MSSDPLEQLIKLLGRLPGIGAKTATRLAFHLVGTPKDYSKALAESLVRVADEIGPCEICGNFTAEPHCRICQDLRRDPSVICVVSRVQDLLALERSGGYRGQYHVLHGLLSPLDGIGPEDLNLDGLRGRVQGQAAAEAEAAGDTANAAQTAPESPSSPPVREVILAISPSVEGETTLLYLARILADLGATVTRIAAGVPIGGELEYTDQVTLGRALADRREV